MRLVRLARLGDTDKSLQSQADYQHSCEHLIVHGFISKSLVLLSKTCGTNKANQIAAYHPILDQHWANGTDAGTALLPYQGRRKWTWESLVIWCGMTLSQLLVHIHDTHCSWSWYVDLLIAVWQPATKYNLIIYIIPVFTFTRRNECRWFLREFLNRFSWYLAQTFAY